MEHWERIAALGASRVFAVDAEAAFSDPGPRLVDGVELIAHLLHPDSSTRRATPLSPLSRHRSSGPLRAAIRRSGHDQSASERDHRYGDHQHQLRRPVPRAEHSALAGDDRQGADHAADQAAEVSADADVPGGRR